MSDIIESTLATPPLPNWKIYFGEDQGIYFLFYTTTPPNRFQRWMIKKVFGITWEKIND